MDTAEVQARIDQNTVWVFTDEGFDELCSALEQSEEVSFDLETTGLQAWARLGGEVNGGVPARIVLASFTTPNGEGEPTNWLLPLDHPESPWRGNEVKMMRAVAQLIKETGAGLMGHNLKFDCRWVYARTGVDLAKNMSWDTAIAAHMIDETKSRKLKEVVPRVFGIDRWDEDIDLSFPDAARTIPLFELGYYAARDTYWVHRLAQVQRQLMFLANDGRFPMFPEEVESANFGRLMTYVGIPTTRNLTMIEETGIGLDITESQRELAEAKARAAELSDELASLYEGLPEAASWAPTSHWFRDWTEKAVEKGDLKIASMTKTGKPQWSKEVLKRQARDGSKVATKLLELRQMSKRVEFLNSWLHSVGGDGRIHAEYNIGSVATGRLSSSGPNMQQVTSALRPCFIPSPGNVLIDLDYSQIEMRVAAFLSRSVPLMQAFRDGVDTHTMMAAKITGKPLDLVTPDERQSGKSANFGLLFGMSAMGYMMYADAVYNVVMTRREAQEAYQAYFDLWEGLRAWHNSQRRFVRNTGQAISPIGRVRRLPGIWDGNEKMQEFAERAAINSPVQGFASDIMQIAAALISGVMPGFEEYRVRGATLVATVHDSIVAEAPADDWERVLDECVEIMERGVLEVLKRLDCDFDVPLKADAKVGTRWGLSDVTA